MRRAWQLIGLASALGAHVAACAAGGGRAVPQDNPHRVVYEGSAGPGAGRHIVLIAGDHEYRSEEILPALARILARRFGFRCSVFFTLDEQGFIEPGSSRIAGLDALETADLLILAIRFQDFPATEMQHLANYLDRGGPVIGLRTATHAFRIASGPFAKYSWDHRGDDYRNGFGRQVLGETWVGHYGTNHEQSSRILPVEARAAHPILRGVRDVHVVSGGYQAYPIEGSTVLAVGQVLDGMGPDAPPDPEKELMPVAWTRAYESRGGRRARVFTTTHGASEDFLNEGFRRMLVNAAMWAVGLDAAIVAGEDVSFVGPFHPVRFSFDGYRRGVRPADLAGWDSPILSPDRPTRDDSRPAGATRDERDPGPWLLHRGAAVRGRGRVRRCARAVPAGRSRRHHRPRRLPALRAVLFFHARNDATVTCQALDWTFESDSGVTRTVRDAITRWSNDWHGSGDPAGLPRLEYQPAVA